nr:uncharacterized protein LOC109415994 [Aedes albopictus]
MSFTSGSKDQCSGNRREYDDRRGCTSDGVYNAEEWDDFVTCTTDRCNRVPHCVVCNSNNPNEANCLNEPEAFIAACLNHGLVQEENCYRQVDGEHFQLGCTSAADFPSGCGDSTVSCRTCEADGCNAKALMECYTCIDCPTVEPQRLTQLCKDIDDYCYTAKHQNGLVERGCLRV